MDNINQKELIEKLLEASKTLERLPKAEYAVINPEIIKNICETKKCSEEEAIVILEQIFN